MRYLIVYLDPTTGRERLGTGPAAGSFGEYASIDRGKADPMTPKRKCPKCGSHDGVCYPWGKCPKVSDR